MKKRRVMPIRGGEVPRGSRGRDIPGLVRRIREAADLTQEQLARRLEVSFGTINGWETGKHLPIRAFETKLIDLARHLGVLPRKSARARIVQSHRRRRSKR